VTGKGTAALNPASSGFFEALGGAAVCFNLWHELTPSFLC
jgi:hypothetical protein